MKKSNSRIKELKSSDIFEHTAAIGYLPRWAVLLLDLALCVVAFLLSYLLGRGLFTYAPVAPGVPVWGQLLILMGVQTVMFWLFHTYAGILRYSTFIDTIKVLLSVFSAVIAYILINYIVRAISHVQPFYTTVAIIYAFIASVGLFCLRVGTKTIYEFARGYSNQKVMIYGIQSAGVAIAKMLRSAGNAPYKPVGFICDADENSNFDLVGLHIHHLNNDLIKYMKAHDIQNVIISPLKMQSISPSRDLNIFLDNDIHILTTPYFTDWATTTTTTTTTTEDLIKNIGRIEAIRVEDLLERPTININTDNVRQIISGKIALVSGAAGSIGSELVRQITKYQPKAIALLEQAESPLHDITLDLRNDFPEIRFIPLIGDVRNRERVEEVFRDFRPDVIFHAAAYKHVPLMESHPNEAIQANVMGTKNMADMAVKYGTERFVMISTDKAVNPTNIMGASKRIAEIYVQSLFNKLHATNPGTTKFITTRFGNVLGSNGSVIPYFKKQIAAGGPVTVTHPDIIRYFMTIPEACTLVMEAATLGNGGEIFVFDMGHPVKIADLAKNMIRLAGFTPGKDIQITFTGLRPGEKLYEELLNQKETTLPTSNEKIMIARVREYDFDTITAEIDKLIAISHEDKVFSTVRQMKHIVPEFISKNSVYEQLDTNPNAADSQ